MRFKKFMLVCAGVLSALAFISEVKSEEPVVVEGKILVRYESSLSAQEVETIEKEFGLQRLNYMSAINTGYYRISGSEDQIDLIERLRKKTGVVLVEEDLLRTQSAAIPNDPLYGQQWYLNSATATHINFQSAIQAFSGTTTIDVAVIDSGILYNHPDFVGKINTTWAYDYVENDTTAQDENGHGTMVASLIGAAHNNGSGLAGVCPNVRFLPLRVFDNAGRFATTTSGVLVSALQRAYDANVRVVNLSLGGGGYSASELSMFEALNSRGIVAVIAAGNGDSYGRGINNDSSPTYPASYSAPNIISVMATDSSGNATVFSNYGSGSVDIAAPGAGIIAANVRRTTAYDDNFSLGANDWLNGTVPGSSPWTRDYRSFRGSFAPYNMAGIYKYFDFTGKQGLRAELTGYLILGYGDILLFEVWDGTAWNYVDVIAWPGDMALSKSLDVSAFDGQVGYARIMLYCDVWSYGASFTRFCEIDTIKITEVASNSTSNPEYLSVDGTSFSAPLVAGTAALLLSKNPALTGAEVKQAILSTASTRSSLSGKSVTGGIVNVSAALAAAQPKQSQTISFSALATKTYGDADFVVNATASSGLSVAYSSSDASVAAISGNTISIVGAGTATITASQLGDSTYSAAANVQQALTINKKNLVIVADNKTKEIGQSDPILTYTSFGLLSGSSISGALSRSAGESVGTYNINQGTITAGNNYAISFTQGTFTISPAAPIPAVITLTSPSGFIYDGNNKAYGVTVVSPPVTAVPTTNIALNKSVTASSVYQDMFSNYSPNKIVNGSTQELRPDPLTPSVSDSGNYWLGKGSNESGYTMPAWLIIDLGQSASINLISILNIVNGVWNDRGSKDFNIQVSLDNSVYSAPVTSGTLQWQNASFQNYPLSTPVTARYVKLNITSAYGSVGSPGINEIKVMTQPVEQSNGTPLSSTAVYTGTGVTVYGPSSTAPKDVGSYRLDVTCTDSSYSGTKTQEFSITPKSATVVALAKTKIYGSTDPVLTYTSSGLVGSDSLSGALTRTAGENVGSYDILVGTLSAGPNYTLSYTGASLGITANTLSSSAINITAPSSLVYDGTGKGHTASASGVSGFSYTYTGVSPTVYPSSATAPTDAGTYSVAVSSADANYSGSKTANFTITPMLVTITAADKTKVYGSADPTLTYTSSGLVGSDSLSGDLTRTAGENVGSYDILVGTLSAGPNYTLSYTGASLGITASTLSSSAINISGPSSLVYDGTGKGHTASASGVSGFSYTYTGVSPTVYPSSATAPKDVGTYTVTASSTDLNNSGSKVLEFLITPKSATVTAVAKTKVYGSPDPALTYTSNGLVGSDSLSGALTRTDGENVGSYAIQIGTLSAGPNYTVSFTEDSMEITPKEVAVVASPKSKLYKSGDPALTFTSSGLLGSDSIRGDLSRVSGENVGFYEIRIGTLSVGDNYSLKFTAASLEITPQPLTVTAVAKTKAYGSADPSLTYTSSGLIGSDSLSGALTRAAGENVGSYDILVGTLSAGPNYTLSYTGASLGITAASLSSSAINITGPSSLVYDGTSKSHTASASGVSGFSYTYTGVSPTVYTSSAIAPKDEGTYTVTASSTDINQSGSKAANFTITPKLVTITAADKTKVYGSADPALTYTSSGLVGSDSLSGDLTRTAGENVGSYDILLGTLSAGANYTLSYAGASLGITASTLSSSAINITAPSSLVYDGTGKGHTASANGISGFSYSYVGVSPTVYPSSATAPTDAGTYTVTASSTDINQSGSKAVNFTITPKLVTITAADKTKIYGSTDPVLTYTSSGLVGSDNLSGALTRAAGENVGSYDILLGTLYAGPNYYFSAAKQIAIESIDMQMVEVGDENNEVDSPSGAGSVAYKYLIGKYEVTAGQYAAFLNSVAKSDPHGLYKSSMNTRSGTPPANVALNKYATASSVYQNYMDSYSAQKAVDGSTSELRPDPLTPNIQDSGNYWLGKGLNESGYTMPAWLLIDLGQSYSISEISVLNIVNGGYRDRGSKDFNIQVSLDGVSYADPILSGTLEWQNETFQTFPFNSGTTARYVKMNITTTYGSYQCPGINEIKIMSAPVSAKAYGIVRSGESGNYTYGVVGSADLPVTGLSSVDAYRFCNWLHNGARSDSSTETGAYTLTGASSSIVSANQNALFRLPTYNEWYKAAFYKGGSQSAGYWNYPTKSDAAPAAVRPGSGANQANYNWTALENVGGYTDSSGPYGTFDMGGNAWELVEWQITLGGGGSATSTEVVNSMAFGGGYSSIGAALRKNAIPLDAASTLDVGIRLVSPAADALGGKLAITHKSLSIAGITILPKRYDGNRAATVSGGELVGVVLGDDVILSGAPTGLFDSPNPGSGIGVVVAGYELSGSSAGNYTLLQPSGLSGSITTTIQSWASAYGLTGQAALAESDPDNDGKNNAAEYAFGGNPATADQQVVSASPVLGGIKFVWLERKVQGQVTYNPKTSADLALSYSSWATVNSAESNPQPVGISTDYKQMEVVLPTSAGKGFLKIEANVQ
jgi:subtilisin family serine protease/formylglycine-generating enzyme required for sulfatase activity